MCLAWRPRCSRFPNLLYRGFPTNSVRQVVCLDRSGDSLLPKKGGEGRGEEAVFRQFPLSPTLSPLVPRGERGKKAISVFHAEHNWLLTRKRFAASKASELATVLPIGNRRYGRFGNRVSVFAVKIKNTAKTWWLMKLFSFLNSPSDTAI